MGWVGVEYHSPEAPRYRRQKGGSSSRLGGLHRARGLTMAPSPSVAARPRWSLPGSRAPSLQSKAQPWKDRVPAQVAHLSPSNTFAPALLLPSLP